jgi:membrane protein
VNGRRLSEPDPDHGGAGLDGPHDVAPASWGHILAATVKEVFRDNVLQLAGALTFFALLSIFPALIVFVSLLALFGQEGTTRFLLDVVAELGPPDAADTVREPIERVINDRAAAETLLTISAPFAILSASGYVGAFMWAANQVYEVEQGRALWRKIPRQILIALAILALLAVLTAVLVLSGPVASSVGNALGMGETAITIYSIVRWPILFFGASVLFSILYYYAPNIRQPGFRWISAGGVVGVVVWLVATVLFNLYTTYVADYGATYGALAGIVIFLLWLWLLNISILAGAELNAELERHRERAEGRDPGESIDLPRREAAEADGAAEEDGSDEPDGAAEAGGRHRAGAAGAGRGVDAA